VEVDGTRKDNRGTRDEIVLKEDMESFGMSWWGAQAWKKWRRKRNIKVHHHYQLIY